MEGAGALGGAGVTKEAGDAEGRSMTHRRHRARGTLAACATVLLVAASSVAAAAVRRCGRVTA